MALATAKGKYIRVSPFKIRTLAEQIRGKDFDKARDILKFSATQSAKYVLKVLESAGANAENVNKIAKDNLFVEDAFIDEGQTLKRVRFRAMGRVNRINKRTSHITIGLSQKGES